MFLPWHFFVSLIIIIIIRLSVNIPVALTLFLFRWWTVIRRTPHEFKIACLEVNEKDEKCCNFEFTFKRFFCILVLKLPIFLQEIRRLFPSDHNPFYAGFGNRDTDELSYLKMGIPKGKIFIINPKVYIDLVSVYDLKPTLLLPFSSSKFVPSLQGEVMNSHSNNPKSYKSLLALVNEIFPPASSVEQVW